MFLFAIICFESSAQESTPIINVNSKTEADVTDWTVYFENETFLIEYKTENCSPPMGYDKEQVVFRMTNKSDSPIMVQWFLQTYYNNEGCKTCDYEDENTYSIKLGAGEVQTGDCDMYKGKTLKITSEFLDKAYTGGAYLSQFALANLIITKL